jgi:hypothetical protein
MSESSAVRVLCIYRVKDGKESAFRPLLEKHWSTLNGIGLVTSEPAQWFLSRDKNKRTCFVEIFEWKDADAPQTAHELPEVMAIWEPMGELVDDMEFLDLETIV